MRLTSRVESFLGAHPARDRTDYLRSRFGVVAALAVAVVLAVAAPMTAHAAGTIRVSSDGVTFGPTYSGVLFAGIAKIVPGDSQTEVFYVRNDGPDDGYLRLTLRDFSGDALLADGLTVSAGVPAHAGSAVTLSKATPCWVLNEGIFLAAGSTVAITAGLKFDAESGNPTQNSTANFDIGINLTDTAVALASTDCGGSVTSISGTVPKADVLSYTGNDVQIFPIIVTAFITGAGLFLVVAARRRKRANDNEQTTPIRP